MQNPDKPFKTYDEQVSILKSRNVYIKNEEIGGSGYSSRETPNRQIQMNKKEHLQGVLHNRRFMPFI